MDNMEHAIEQVAKVIAPALEGHGMEQCSESGPNVRRRWIQCSCDEAVEYGGVPAWEEHRAQVAARALAEAGLINGFRPGRWWRVMGPDSHLWAEASSEREARERMRPGDRLYRQWETGRSTWWVPVEGVNRAEGDGRADQ